MTKRQAILLPEEFDGNWQVISDEGVATMDLSRLDFRATTNAEKVFRFYHREWTPLAEGHLSLLSFGMPTINPVLCLTDKEPRDWSEWLGGFDTPHSPASAGLLLATLLKTVSVITTGEPEHELTVIMPASFRATDIDTLATCMNDTSAVTVWESDDKQPLSVELVPQPVPWVGAALCALAVETDQKTDELKPRRSGDATALGVTFEVLDCDIWPVFIINVRQAEVPYLIIKGYLFSLEKAENPSTKHKNASLFSRSLGRISEGTLYLKDALDPEAVAKIRDDFATRAGAIGVNLKDAKVRSLLTPGAERDVGALGVDDAAFRDVWSVIEEKPDLLLGTFVYQSSMLSDAPEPEAGDEKEGQGGKKEDSSEESPKAPSTDEEAKTQENKDKEPVKKIPQKTSEDNSRVAKDAAQDDNIDAVGPSLDNLADQIASDGDESPAEDSGDEDHEHDLGQGPWDDDVERVYELTEASEWHKAQSAIEEALNDPDADHKKVATVVRREFRQLVEASGVIGYPALEALVESLGFSLVDCSKGTGPTIRQGDGNMEPILLGGTKNSNTLGGSSHHAGQLIEAHQDDLDTASRYLEWAAGHPLWGPEKHYLKNLLAALDSFINMQGDTKPVSHDPIGLFLRKMYFERLPKLRPEALGNPVLIAAHLSEIDQLDRPQADGIDAQRAAAKALWSGDLKNGNAFLPREQVPSNNKDNS